MAVYGKKNYVSLPRNYSRERCRFNNKLNFHEHVATAAKKANRNIGTIKNTFSCLDSAMVKKLCVSLVRSVLEYGTCNCVRSPRLKTDIWKIEQV